jgi:hypothetical protein
MFGGWTFPLHALRRWWLYTVLRRPMLPTVVQGSFSKLFKPGLRQAFLDTYNERVVVEYDNPESGSKS